MKEKQIQIPGSIFFELVDLLDNYIDISQYDNETANRFTTVLYALKDKKETIKKREAYSDLLEANKQNDNKEILARINYLQLKK